GGSARRGLGRNLPRQRGGARPHVHRVTPRDVALRRLHRHGERLARPPVDPSDDRAVVPAGGQPPAGVHRPLRRAGRGPRAPGRGAGARLDGGGRRHRRGALGPPAGAPRYWCDWSEVSSSSNCGFAALTVASGPVSRQNQGRPGPSITAASSRHPDLASPPAPPICAGWYAPATSSDVSLRPFTVRITTTAASFDGLPSGWVNWPVQRSRFWSALPPCPCPKKNSTSSASSSSVPLRGTRNWAARMSEGAGTRAQSSGTRKRRPAASDRSASA